MSYILPERIWSIFTIGNIVSSLGGLTIQNLRYVFGWKLPYRPGVLTKKTCWNDQETERDDDDDDDYYYYYSTNKKEMVLLVETIFHNVLSCFCMLVIKCNLILAQNFSKIKRSSYIYRKPYHPTDTIQWEISMHRGLWLLQEYLMYHFWTPLTGLVAVGVVPHQFWDVLRCFADAPAGS